MAVSGGSVVSDSIVNTVNANSSVTPILQAEDGSYFGTEMWTPPFTYYALTAMDAFDLSGNVKWSVPGFTPVMATADSGVIAKTTSNPVQ